MQKIPKYSNYLLQIIKPGVQIHERAVEEYGEVTGWFVVADTAAENSHIFFNNMKPYLKILRECGVNPGCLPEKPVKRLDGVDYVNYEINTNEPRVILADGTFLMFYSSGSGCTATGCGNIKVDIDGLKGPYTFAKDFFTFSLTQRGIYPTGILQQGEALSGVCNAIKSNSSNNPGNGCTAWVVYNENLDYLHCNDLSWGVKTTCK